jgi:uracil-DNA glycosylase family 4
LIDPLSGQFVDLEQITAAYADKPLVSLELAAIPAAGPDFYAQAAMMLGLDPKHKKAMPPEFSNALVYLYKQALYTPGFTLPITMNGRQYDTVFLSGTFRGSDNYGPYVEPDATGELPFLSTVMVIGKEPGAAEMDQGYNFIGPPSLELDRALAEVGVPEADVATWYFTNVMKHMPLNPNKDGIPAAHLKNCLPLLWLEIAMRRPKAILVLGTDAIKAVLGKENTSSMRGRVGRIAIPGTDEFAAVIGAVHPAYVRHKPEAYDELRDGVSQFYAVTQGEDVGRREEGLHHEAIYTADRLRQVVDEIVADREHTAIAVDCEWHGKYPTDEGAYLRTVQFSHKPKHGYAVVLWDENGDRCFRDPDQVKPLLERLLLDTPERKVRVGGQFFRADLPWLIHQLDLDLRPQMLPPESAAATKYAGGWDTGYMANAVNESATSYKLELLAASYCGVSRYDIKLQEWKSKYCRDNNLTDKELEGYGPCPSEILLGTPRTGEHGPDAAAPVLCDDSYACFDVDATIRLFYKFNGTATEPGLLDRDQFGVNSREAFFNDMSSWNSFLEMEMTGVSIDRHRADELTALFMDGLDKLLNGFRRRIGWRGFNPNSANMCRELLFGQSLNGTVDKETGKPKRLRPTYSGNAWIFEPKPLGLTPIKAAGKRAPTWDRVLKDGKLHLFNPSTDRETLNILGQRSSTVRAIRDIRYVAQALKSVLRPPIGLVEAADSDESYFDYDGGLLYWASDDGRVRTHFYPVETGRCSSSRPAMQNLSSRRESDYKRIFGCMVPDPETKELRPEGDYLTAMGGPRYLYPTRSVIRAAPGRVLVEADYKSAELYALAWLAGCRRMQEDLARSLLDEDHPDALDLHSQAAVTAFQLRGADGNLLKPTKTSLDKAGKLHLRTGGKTVVFSVPYGSGAKAVARKCREEGANVTDEDAQRMIDGYFELYPENYVFLESCMARVTDPGYMIGTFGRARRFHVTSEESVVEDMRRQARNFGIQNAVAEAIKLAMWELYKFREDHLASGGKESFDMVLQVHDALVFEVDPQYAGWLINEVIPECMTRRVTLRPRDLDGNLVPDAGEFHFLTDCEVYENWGVKLKGKQLADRGITV